MYYQVGEARGEKREARYNKSAVVCLLIDVSILTHIHPQRMPERSSIFDMIGPIMIGPSSSHTAGVARIGRTSRRLFGRQPESVIITFYNSFARTYEGHGSDRAILAGLLDFAPDDIRLRESLDLAAKANMAYQFKAVMNASALHPNSIRIELTAGKRTLNVLGVSKGGGMIKIVALDGFTCNFGADTPTLIISAQDRFGSVAFISSVIRHEECNIATLTVDRSARHDRAKLVFELDSDVRELTLEYIKSLSWVTEVQYLETMRETAPQSDAASKAES